MRYAFYGAAAPGLENTGRVLKAIPHDRAIHHIVATILAQHDGNYIVPLVRHFDEHGAFTKRVMVRLQKEPSEEGHTLDMLRAIGSAVTSSSSPLRKELNGRFFIVLITTGTSNRDANIGDVSTYMVRPVPLPVLSFEDTKKLAQEYFRLQLVEQDRIGEELNLPALQVGLANTAGLPGLVGMGCDGGISINLTGSYSQSLQTAVTVYTAERDIEWSTRWPDLAIIVLARPVVDENDVIYDDYTVSKARDSGAILFGNNEIGVSSALYTALNLKTFFASKARIQNKSVDVTRL